MSSLPSTKKVNYKEGWDCTKHKRTFIVQKKCGKKTRGALIGIRASEHGLLDPDLTLEKAKKQFYKTEAAPDQLHPAVYLKS